MVHFAKMMDAASCDRDPLVAAMARNHAFITSHREQKHRARLEAIEQEDAEMKENGDSYEGESDGCNEERCGLVSK